MIWLTLLIGALAGYLSGLLGIGGGVIITPCLFFLFSAMGLPSEHVMKFAIGTSMSAMTISTLIAAISHKKRGGVISHAFFGLLPGVIVGGVIGAMIASYIPGNILKWIFVCYVVFAGLKMIFGKQPAHKKQCLPSKLVLSFCGLGIGSISAMLGVGGGIINVPLLSYFHVQMKQAVGTSAAITFFAALSGTFSFIFFGAMQNAPHVPDALGYIMLPGFILVGLSATILAPLGVKAAHMLPASKLKKIFGVVIILAGGALLFKG